ncbi:MAG: hypothetical protein K2X67_03630 [Burkholderiales bacterium]|nr:hypothetical protein [Burkholderiales bacterium]
MRPKLIPVGFAAQILPGTFEHALNVLVDDDLDLSAFEGSFKNDDKGAPAYHPGVLLKIVLGGIRYCATVTNREERYDFEPVQRRLSAR